MTPKPIWTWIQSIKIKKPDMDTLPTEQEQLQIQSPKPDKTACGHPAVLVEKTETNGKTDVEMHLIQTAAPSTEQQVAPSINGNGAEHRH